MEEEKINYTAAYLHIMEAAKLLNPTNHEVGQTLADLAVWIRSTYSLDEREIGMISNLTKEI